MVKKMIKLSNDASKCLEKIEKSFKVLRVIETLDHDGYDMYGPKSNIWVLYVLYKNNNADCVFVYNREDWFDYKHEDYRLVYNIDYKTLVKKTEKTILENEVINFLFS